jgi:hypothetical protein
LIMTFRNFHIFTKSVYFAQFAKIVYAPLLVVTLESRPPLFQLAVQFFEVCLFLINISKFV